MRNDAIFAVVQMMLVGLYGMDLNAYSTQGLDLIPKQSPCQNVHIPSPTVNITPEEEEEKETVVQHFLVKSEILNVT